MTTTPQESSQKISGPFSEALDQESLQHGLRLAGARVYTYGETAIVLELEKASDSLAPAKQQCIWALAHLFQQRWAEHPGIRDIVPANHNMTIIFDPLSERVSTWISKLRQCWQDLNQQNISTTTPFAGARTHQLAVAYGGEYGPDLKAVAQIHGLDVEEVIKRHSTSMYTVAFVGFQPGFAYLDGLDPALQTPRLAQPRTRIPANSVAIGGTQTGIYPADSPGGWHIIGRYITETQASLFDVNREQPSLLATGDFVNFVWANA
ncbi:MAG: 5-oxoprolinase subunit PxpB [Pseudomonadales bacterium]|nr:5-oxoprolinase subunit PxpB [Pseudomonadales bacterium]MDG2078032.1 5-oxoprolinase subunit PxpB [Pseudomonadales bacterium]